MDRTTPGTLYVCATPIGNMDDITIRVLDTLKSCDVIFAEDTRVTKKLLSRYSISTPLERCDENVSQKRIDEIANRLLSGQNIALVSDAGTPVISDPGQNIVCAIREMGFVVTVLPGACALTTAIAGSGLDLSSGFIFLGFLPRKTKEAKKLLESLIPAKMLIAFYESPKRIRSTAKLCAEIFGDSKACMARELTKIYEEYLVGSATFISEELQAREGEIKGEIVFIVETAGVSLEEVSKEELLSKAEDLAGELAKDGRLSASGIARSLTKELGVEKDLAYKIASASRSQVDK